MAACLLSATDAPCRSDEVVDSSYYAERFGLARLGIALVPADKPFPHADEALEELEYSEGFLRLFRGLTDDFLRRNTEFFDWVWLDSTFGTRTMRLEVKPGTSRDFVVPTSPAELARMHGLGYLLVVQDLAMVGGVFVRKSERIIPPNRRGPQGIPDRTEDVYPTVRYQMACEFWYAVLDLHGRKMVQFGNVANEDKAYEPELDDWETCIRRTLEELTKGAPFEREDAQYE